MYVNGAGIRMDVCQWRRNKGGCILVAEELGWMYASGGGIKMDVCQWRRNKDGCMLVAEE